MPHFLIGRDIHRREEADLGEDHAVHDEDEHKKRRDGKMRAEETAQCDDDDRRDHPAQHRPRNLADDERIGADRGDEILLKAPMVHALRVHRDDAVKADVHRVHREQPRHEKVEIRTAPDVDAPSESPPKRDEEHERRDHPAQHIFHKATPQDNPVPPKHRPNIAAHQSPSFRPVSSMNTSSRFVGRRSTRRIRSSRRRTYARASSRVWKNR